MFYNVIFKMLNKLFNKVIFVIALLMLCACTENENNDSPDDDNLIIENGEISFLISGSAIDWELVWSDEFEGSSLNLDNWEIQLGDGLVEGIANGWGNNELQYYTEDNVTVSNGNLVITSMADNPIPDPAFGDDPSYEFSSGRIRTQGKFDFTYGRVEARIKMPDTKGIWNAFWLLGSDPSPYGAWAAKGEIDIVEAYFRGEAADGTEPYVSGAAHYGGPFPYNEFTDKLYESFNHYDDFHIYAVEWDEQEIRWFIDGVNFFSLRSDNYWNYYQDAFNGFQPGGVNAPFDQDFHIILNAAVGGNLPNGVGELPIADPSFYGEMLVDYVRVYQCSDTTQGGINCKNNNNPNKANFSFDFLAYEFPVNNVFFNFTDLYINGPGPEPLLIIRELAFQETFGLTATEVLNSENGNTYLEIDAPAASSGQIPAFSIIDPDGDPFILSGFTPNGLGDFKFNLYVDSTQRDPNGNMRVSIISGGSTRQSVIYDLEDLEPDTWYRFTIPIMDILTGQGTGTVDVGDITELIRFEFSNAVVRIDNLQFACGGQVCGIVDEVPVYIDSVEPIWDRGIVGDDTLERNLNGNPDYTDGTQYHVQWEEIDYSATEPERGTVVQTTFGNTGADGAVNFIGANTAVPSIAALTQGEFRFDIRVIENPNDVQLLFKVDAIDPATRRGTSTGEQPLGNLPVVGPNGPWTRFTCPIATLQAQGLNIAEITAPFVLVPGNRGAGQGVVVQWDEVTFSPIATGNVNPLELPLIFDDLPGFCLPIQPFAGGVFTILDNPLQDAANSNTRVVRIKKFSADNGDLFGGIAIQLSTPIEFGQASSTAGKAFTIKTFSQRVGMPVTFKLESQPGVGPARTFQTTVANAWEQFTVDFNGEGTNSFSTVTLIVDDGVAGDGGDNFTLYIDEIEQIDSGSTAADLSTVYNFDQPNTTYPLTDFGEARSQVSSGPVGDPLNDGLMGEVTLNDFAFSVAGTTMGGAEGFPNPIPFDALTQKIQVRVWTPAAGTSVILKVEDSEDAFQFDEDTQVTTQAGWQTLTFDFTDANLADTFEKLIIIFAPGENHNGETYYWDDVELVP